jgi:predicted signal transduction protein with EAL and GGDEF domain
LRQVVIGNGVRITFSAGLTEHPPGEPLHETLERADRGLYKAKEQGRNRVEWVRVATTDQSHVSRSPGTPLAQDDQV